MAFRWRDADGLHLVLFGSSLLSSKTNKYIKNVVKLDPSGKTFWIRACHGHHQGQVSSPDKQVHIGPIIKMGPGSVRFKLFYQVTEYCGEMSHCLCGVHGNKAPVTHSRFWLRLITIRPDETYIVKSGWSKQKILKSLRCLTTFLRYLYDSSTIHDGATTMLLRCYYGRVTT